MADHDGSSRDVPELPSRKPDQADDKASRESAAFRENLEKEARQLQHQRLEGAKKHFHWGLIILMWIGIATFGVILITWAWHLVTPWHYLSMPAYNDLKNVLFSAALASFVLDHIKKIS